MLSAVSLFSRFGSFFFVFTSDFQFIDAIIIDRPSQGVKTLKNNAIIIMTVIILMGRVERKPDVVAFEDKRRRPTYTSTQSDQCLCCSPF